MSFLILLRRRGAGVVVPPGTAARVTRNPERPVTVSSRLVFDDGTITNVMNYPSFAEYELTVEIVGAVDAAAVTGLGTELNAAYHQTLAALTDRTLGGVVMHVREERLEPAIVQEPGTDAVAGFVLELRLRYEDDFATATKRTDALAALATALEANQPQATLCLRERAMAALVATLTAATTTPVVRNADRPVQTFPRWVVEDGLHEVLALELGRTRYRMEVRATIHAAADDVDDIPPILQAEYVKLLGAVRGDEQLGGLVDDMQEAGDVAVVLDEAGTSPAMSLTSTIAIEFTTDETDVAVAA